MQEHRQEINALYYGLLSLSVYRRVTEQPVTRCGDRAGKGGCGGG